VNPPYPTISPEHPPFPSVGLGYLAAVLEQEHYTVDILDCQSLKLSYEQIKKEIQKRQPDIIGITTTTLLYKSAVKVAKIAKQVCPSCLAVMGGHQVTFWDDRALQEHPEIDIVVRKEGEYTLLEIVQRTEAGKDVSKVLGTTCKKDGEIVRNPDRPFIQNLDDMPFPAHHLWPIKRLRGNVMFQIVTSRGCVHFCSFCCEVRMQGRKFRMRSPNNVVDEIEYLHKRFGADFFSFSDAAFTVDQARAEEICNELRRRGLKIRWRCETRVDMVSKDLFATMKNSGCVGVAVGMESGSQKILDAMQKGITLQQVVKTCCMAREVGLTIEPIVILGFPGETKETAWETILFVERVCPDYLGTFAIATPYPGTPLYEMVKENGWLKITDFDRYDMATPTFETPWLSMKELAEIREQAYRSYYFRPQYVLHRLVNGGMYGLEAIKTTAEHVINATKSKIHNNLT
jgi:radical SAM superfamily enzyme YgiQ (UPF0313 family)